MKSLPAANASDPRKLRGRGCVPRILFCLFVSIVANLRADNAKEIIGTWEQVGLKAGVAKVKSDAMKKTAFRRQFDGAGSVRDRGSLINTGSYKFVSDKELEMTTNGKLEKYRIRIMGDTMVTTRMDGSIEIEEKWKRVK